VDELDTRIRSLEAERLRPVPPAPPAWRPPVEADLPAIAAEAARAERAYEAAVKAHARTRAAARRSTPRHTLPETPGPSASSETTRKDR